MKKLLITALAIMATVASYGQGTVNFGNSSTTRVTDATKNPIANVLSTQMIAAGLFWAPLSDPNNFTQLGASVIIGSGQPGGVFAGGARTTGTETAPGGAARFQVRAWELAYGATFDAAIAAPAMNGRVALRGVSNIVQGNTGDPTASPPGTPLSLTTAGLTGFSVNVPEPSVVALGVMGIGALLLLRRRSK